MIREQGNKKHLSGIVRNRTKTDICSAAPWADLGKGEITNVIYEPWHFRYLGLESAIYMKANDLCLEEFLALYGVE